VPKKVEVPIIPPPIGSMEALVINHDGPIVIEEILAQQDEALEKLLELKIRNTPKEIPTTANLYGVLVCWIRLNGISCSVPNIRNRRGSSLPRWRVESSTPNTSKSLGEIKTPLPLLASRLSKLLLPLYL
jgi:hypothetical protein